MALHAPAREICRGPRAPRSTPWSFSAVKTALKCLFKHGLAASSGYSITLDFIVHFAQTHSSYLVYSEKEADVVSNERPVGQPFCCPTDVQSACQVSHSVLLQMISLQTVPYRRGVISPGEPSVGAWGSVKKPKISDMSEKCYSSRF